MSVVLWVHFAEPECQRHPQRLQPPLLSQPAALQSIFVLFNSVYSELDDPASPHFQLCLSTLETVSQVGAPLSRRNAWRQQAQSGPRHCCSRAKRYPALF